MPPPLPSAEKSNERPRETKPPPAARPARAFASGLLNSSSSYTAPDPTPEPASRSRSATSMTLPNAPVRRAEIPTIEAQQGRVSVRLLAGELDG